MLLSIGDRLNIINSLPEKGTFEEGIISKDLRQKLSITQDEILKTELKSADERLFWNAQKDEGLEVDFKPLEASFLIKAFKHLNDTSNLPLHDSFIHLYETILKLETPA